MTSVDLAITYYLGHFKDIDDNDDDDDINLGLGSGLGLGIGTAAVGIGFYLSPINRKTREYIQNPHIHIHRTGELCLFL